ncbi:MAG: 50S ribosomal protein L17 [Candidatus Omnitrophota bacterium]
MRHGKIKRKLSRSSSERKALFRSLVYALMTKQRIVTTVQKAKEARRVADKVITIAKKGDIASRRRLFAIFVDRTLVKELVDEIAPRFKKRAGGYTRIIRLSQRRKGDNAEMAVLELTEMKVVAPEPKKGKKGQKAEVKSPKAEKETVQEGEIVSEGNDPKHAHDDKHTHHDEQKKPHFDKASQKGFFGGLQRFLKPKQGM